MNEILGKLLSRLSKYDWFTTLLPGMFLLALIRRVGINASAESIIEELGLVFFLGVVSSRVGATCVEQIARWCKLFEPYEDYVDWFEKNAIDVFKGRYVDEPMLKRPKKILGFWL